MIGNNDGFAILLWNHPSCTSDKSIQNQLECKWFLFSRCDSDHTDYIYFFSSFYPCFEVGRFSLLIFKNLDEGHLAHFCILILSAVHAPLYPYIGLSKAVYFISYLDWRIKLLNMPFIGFVIISGILLSWYSWYFHHRPRIFEFINHNYFILLIVFNSIYNHLLISYHLLQMSDLLILLNKNSLSEAVTYFPPWMNFLSPLAEMNGI